MSLVNEVKSGYSSAAKVVNAIDTYASATKYLDDRVKEIVGPVLPLHQFCNYDVKPMISTLNDFVYEAKQSKIDSDTGFKMALVNLIPVLKGDIKQQDAIKNTWDIYKAASRGKHKGEKLLGFWSTWDGEVAEVLAMFNAYDQDVAGVVRDADQFYQDLKPLKMDSTMQAMFAARHIGSVRKGTHKKSKLINAAELIKKTSKKGSEIKFDSEDTEKLMLCYADEVSEGRYSVHDIVNSANTLYQIARNKNKSIGKDKWDSATALKITCANAGQILESNTDSEELVEAINTAYTQFQKTLPKKGFIFKSNKELSEIAAISYTTALNSFYQAGQGIKGRMQDQVISDTIDQIVEESVMTTLLMTTVVLNSVIMNANTINS